MYLRFKGLKKAQLSNFIFCQILLGMDSLVHKPHGLERGLRSSPRCDRTTIISMPHGHFHSLIALGIDSWSVRFAGNLAA